MLYTSSIGFLKKAVFAFFCSAVYYVGVFIACTVYYRLRFEASIGFFKRKAALLTDRWGVGFYCKFPLFCEEGEGNKNGKVVWVRAFELSVRANAQEVIPFLPKYTGFFFSLREHQFDVEEEEEENGRESQMATDRYCQELELECTHSVLTTAHSFGTEPTVECYRKKTSRFPTETVRALCLPKRKTTVMRIPTHRGGIVFLKAKKPRKAKCPISLPLTEGCNASRKRGIG